MSNSDRIKKLLGMSTSMPMGTGAKPGFMTGSHLHGHAHGPNCGCNHGHEEEDEE